MSRSRARHARRDAPVAPAPARSWRHVALALLIVAAGIATFWNSLGGPFIWDDDTAIVSNKTIQRLWPLTSPLSPPRETPVAGRPLVNLSFAINYALGGVSETGYHATNIALHVACALLLFAIVRRTLASAPMPSALKPGADSTALVATLLWLVHPLQSEVVDYVTQRSESLMALFFFLTLYGAIRAARPVEEPKAISRGHAGAWQALSIAACACGMASKEPMVVAPLVVVLYDRTFLFGTLANAWRQRRPLYLGLAATWVVLAVLVGTSPRSTVGTTTSVGAWTYLLNQAGIVCRYLWLSIWPGALVLDYGLPRQVSFGDVAPMALLLLALLAATVVALVRWPKVGFAAAAFFLTLGPTSSVVPIVSEVGAERRMYLPLAALATLAVVSARYGLERLRTAAPRVAAAGAASTVRRAHAQADWPVIAATVLTAVLLAALALRTVARNAEFASALTLWQTSVDRYPHGRSRMALGAELVTAGQAARAIAVLREAVPDFPDARAALGAELVGEGQLEEGVAVLRQFIAADPTRVNRIPAHVLLAQALASRGDVEGAIASWRTVTKIAPDDRNARAQLAGLLARQGETLLRREDGARAEPYAREAAQLTPADPAVRNLLGAALASAGRFDEAIAQFREALQIAPNDPQARANLERALSIVKSAR